LLKHLHELTAQDLQGEFLPKEQREAVFQACGLDPAKTAVELKIRIARLAGAHQLEAARAARREAQVAHQTHVAALARADEGLRAHVERLLERLAQNQPALAAVYCRKFEHATEADMVSMKEDLLLLEQLEQENPGHDSGNRA
jgi:hypothetical protein